MKSKKQETPDPVKNRRLDGYVNDTKWKTIKIFFINFLSISHFQYSSMSHFLD